LNVGVVGCGYWGPNLVRSAVETNRCDQIFCCDLSKASLAKVVRRFPCVCSMEHLDDMIERCDAIMVATPVSTHYEIAKRILLRGKAVLVEKPLAISSTQARELMELASEKDLTLMVGHTFVYSPAVRKVKEYIRDGVVGDIYFLSSSRVNLGIHQKDIDVLWDLAPHDLSILLYWLGENPSRVSAIGRACIGTLPDVASIHYHFPSGILANLEVSWLAPSKLRRTVLVGSRSMLIYDDTNLTEKVKLYDKGVDLKVPESFGEYQLTYRTGEIICPNLNATEPLLIEINHFLDCVESGAQPETDGRTGLDVVLALEAASHSMRSNGQVTEIHYSAIPGGVPAPQIRRASPDYLPPALP
jgi:predicted dehydrogenase